MNMTNKDIQQQMSRFKEDCRNLGVKLTHQRMEIFREVLQTEKHPDAETVYRGVRRRMPTVSLDTVYRTLWWLKDIGLITTLGISRDRTRFDANLTRHHHFVCNQCGKTRDFYSDVFDSRRIPCNLSGTQKESRLKSEAYASNAQNRGSPTRKNKEGRSFNE